MLFFAKNPKPLNCAVTLISILTLRDHSYAETADIMIELAQQEKGFRDI